MAVQATESNNITLINVFEVPNEKVEEAIKWWEAAKKFLATQPGYIETKLHKATHQNARFVLINIAKSRY